MECRQCGNETVNPNFCSNSCAAKFNNHAFPKRKIGWKKCCKNCNISLTSWRQKCNTYCSAECRKEYQQKEILEKILKGEEHLPRFLKRYLVKTVGDFCVLCKHSGEWNGLPLVLELDHIDGNSDNCLPSNLRLLCPNCHSQQPTSKGNGKNHKKFHRRNVLRHKM